MSNKSSACPCKRIVTSWSSFTAAEYGDIRTILRKHEGDVNRVSDVGRYNLLHLTAQHGHTAATSTLLERGAMVDGTPKSKGGCGATPLHRCSYSGAVSTMKVLLEWHDKSDASNACDLLAKDESFGDEMTPLHKACAGGRFRAAQLLLNHVCDRLIVEGDCEKYSVAHAEAQRAKVSQLLHAKDAYSRTPRDVARGMVKHNTTERGNVARWDAVAGGKADWEKCISLLETAESWEM